MSSARCFEEENILFDCIFCYINYVADNNDLGAAHQRNSFYDEAAIRSYVGSSLGVEPVFALAVSL